jgi:hypothetical protein
MAQNPMGEQHESDGPGAESQNPLDANFNFTWPSRATIAVSSFGVVTVAIFGAAWPFLAPAFRRHVLPYVPASESQVKNVLSAIRHRPAGSKFVDLGSGDGRISIAAAKAGFMADGIELNPWLALYSRCEATFQRTRQLLTRSSPLLYAQCFALNILL